jgi:hypothetical protein
MAAHAELRVLALAAAAVSLSLLGRHLWRKLAQSASSAS